MISIIFIFTAPKALYLTFKRTEVVQIAVSTNIAVCVKFSIN